MLRALPLLALLGCPPGKDAAAPADDTGPDTAGDTDPAADTDTAADTDSAADTGDTDAGPDTGACEPLSSDDAVASDGCGVVTPICASGACTLAVDLDLVDVSGALADVDPAAGEWWLLFRDPTIAIDPYNPIRGSTWGTAVPFGTVAAPLSDAAFAVRMFPGVYEVALAEGEPGDPDQSFPLASGWALTGDTSLDVDLTFHAVRGDVTVDGTPVTGAPWVVFADAATGAHARFRVVDGAYAGRLPDGTWDVTLAATDSVELARADFPVGTVVVAGADVTEDLAVDAHPVGGAITYEGAPLPDPGEDTVYILRFFADDGRAAELYLGETATWATRLPPGTWTPVFGAFRAGEPFEVPAAASVDLAEVLGTASGTLSVNGGDAAGWSLLFVDPALGVSASAGGAAWTATLSPGTYDVYARISSLETTKLAEGVVVEDGAELAYAFDAVDVDGVVTVDGRAPRDGWSVVFVEAGSGVKTWARATEDDAWGTELRVGVYDVYVLLEHWLGNRAVPVARDLAIDGDTCLALDVPLYRLDGTVLLDGALPTGGDDVWTLVTHQPGNGETVTDTLDAADAAWSLDLPAGVYTFLAAFDSLHEAGTPNLVPVRACVAIGPS